MKISALPFILIGSYLLFGCGRDQRSTADASSSNPAYQASEPAQVIIPPDSPKRSRIRVESVQLARIPLDEALAPGNIEVNPNRVSHVTMPVPGRVRKVLVRLGDAVREGAPLLRVESPEVGSMTAAYRQAQAAVNQSQATLLKAEADLSRLRDLYENRAVAKKEVLNAESLLAQAQAELEQAQASREEAIRRSEILGLKPGEFGQEVTVRAPISGKVLEITVAPGEYRNDISAALMTIADLSTVWMVSDIPESSIRLIKGGEPIEIELSAYPGETFQARVTRIADTVDAQTRTVRVWAEMKNLDGRFRPEMFGRVRHSESFRMLPVVPVGAIIQGDRRTTVLLEQSPGVFQPVDVETGERHGDRVPILKGLKPGDRVVVDGTMLLKTS